MSEILLLAIFGANLATMLFVISIWTEIFKKNNMPSEFGKNTKTKK